MKASPRGIRIVKILAAAILISWIAATVEWSRFGAACERALNPWLLGPLVFLWISLALSAVRWRILLQALGCPIPVSYLLKACLAGLFANNFLPTAIGGDVVRMMLAARRTGDSAAASASVIVDRLTGLLAVIVCLLGAAAFNWDLALKGANGWILVVTILAFLAGGLVIFLLLRTRIRRNDAEKNSHWTARVLDWLNRVIDAFRAFRNKPGALAEAVALSFAFHFFAVAAQWAACRAVGLDVSYLLLLFVTSLVFAAGLLPVTPNGYGLQDQLFMLELGWAGYAAEDALAAFLLVRLALLITSLAGAWMVFEVRRAKSEERN